MIIENYDRHFRVDGKYCYLWDTASASVTDMKTLEATTFDQIATGTIDSVPGVELQSTFASRWAQAIANGPASLKTLAVDFVTSYLISADFRGDLVSVPVNPSSAKSVLDAWILDMTNDNITLKTASGTGLVNFFVTNFAPDGSFPQSDTPSYPDDQIVIEAVSTYTAD